MQHHKTTVVLNVWNDHVSTYESLDNTPSPQNKPWREVSLAVWRDNDIDDDHAYDDMKEFDWCELSDAVESNQQRIFWITQSLCGLENGLREKRLAFVPR